MYCIYYITRQGARASISMLLFISYQIKQQNKKWWSLGVMITRRNEFEKAKNKNPKGLGDRGRSILPTHYPQPPYNVLHKGKHCNRDCFINVMRNDTIRKTSVRGMDKGTVGKCSRIFLCENLARQQKQKVYKDLRRG